MWYLTQNDVDKLMNILRGKAPDEDIKEALQRLDRLTQEELRNVAALILGTINGKQTHAACNPISTTECLPLDIHASVDGIREDISTFCL